MSVAYIDTSAQYNGDGTSPDQATSDGGPGAYNNIQSFFDNASTSGQTIGVLRRLNLGTSIVPSATLSPVNDGSFDTPLLLIGYPFSRTLTGKSINGVDPWSRNNGSRFSFYTTDADLGQSSDYDHYWESAIITIYQAGSANDGLQRTVIFSKYDSSDGMRIAFFPDLPEDLTTSATFDISLQTYNPDDVPSVNAWDSDTNARPFVDGSGLSANVFDFNNDFYWGFGNCRIRSASGYYCINKLSWGKNLCLEGGYGADYLGYYAYFKLHLKGKIKHIYADVVRHLLTDAHLDKNCFEHIHENASYYNYSAKHAEGNIANSSFGKVTGAGTYCVTISNYYAAGAVTNCDFYLPYSTNIYSESAHAGVRYENCMFNGIKRDLVVLNYFYTMKTITSADSSYWSAPPSGANIELMVSPSRANNVEEPLDFWGNFNHPAIVQAGTSKTITVKFRPNGWSNLTNKDIWIEVEYLDESTGIHTAVVSSRGDGSVSYANDNWYDLSVTFTPAQSGIVKVKCFLTAFESGAYVLIDPDSGS